LASTLKNNESRSKAFKYALVVATVLVVLAASFFYTSKKENESAVYTKTLMGTVVQITLMDGDAHRFDEAAEAAFGEISRLEAVFSSYKDGSDVALINAAAGSGLVDVRPETIEVLREALRVAALSDGAFNPAVGVFARVWGPSGEKGEAPAPAEIKKLLGYVDLSGVLLKEHEKKAGLKKEGMAINLGGVAKGYIVSKAASVLRKTGVTKAIIHAGGDMVVFQRNTDTPFIVGIQHPREKKLIGEARLYNGAVATSGDYERFFIKDDVRYHHILDPKTGFPSKGVQGVTLIAKDPTEADALSTAVFVLGPEKGMALIERLKDVEGVIVDENGRVTVSSGFQGKIY
jgi:FAD:protein FMN transferase